MKLIAFTIIASTLTGCFGYWAASDDLPASVAKTAARPQRQAKRSGFVPEPQIVLASDTQSAEPKPQVEPQVEPELEPDMPPLEGPVEGFEFASVEDDIRFVPTTRPTTPQPQHPPLSDETNVDSGKPVHEWQRLTDDWFGLRPRLDDRGISFQASLTADYSKVLKGGVDTEGDAFRHLFNVTATVDTERLLNWHGGTLFANFQNQNGDDGAEDVGNLQGLSNIDADGRTQIAELWYEQLLFNDKLRLKIGKVDANADFAHTATADEFINGAFGAAPTILAFPTYPDPAMSVNVFVKPTDHFFAGVGVYDGSTQVGATTGNYGPAEFFGGGAHLFYIGEAGFNWTTSRGLDGVFTVGVWHHTAGFDRFDGGTDSSATGEYVMFDQKLWRESDDKDNADQGISLFAKYGYADPDVSDIEHHIAIGAAWTGLIPQRDDDVLGVGMSWARLSDQGDFAHNTETVYELFYRLRLNAWFSVKPDLQYIHNAADGGARDTVAGTVRMVIDF